jgi:tRNA threonylcarbamoyladenosine biosynthesis protein TsaE
MHRTLRSRSEAETFAWGVKLGEQLTEGAFVGLTGHLGAGKTLFSRGVAQGAGVPLDDVSSPTYAIVQSYRGRLALHHADLYRLTSEADLYSTGYFDTLESPGAMLVEWVDQVPGAAPDDALRISLSVVSPEERDFELHATGPASAQLLERWLAAR